MMTGGKRGICRRRLRHGQRYYPQPQSERDKSRGHPLVMHPHHSIQEYTCFRCVSAARSSRSSLVEHITLICDTRLAGLAQLATMAAMRTGENCLLSSFVFFDGYV